MELDLGMPAPFHPGSSNSIPPGITVPLKLLLKCQFIAQFSLIFPGRAHRSQAPWSSLRTLPMEPTLGGSCWTPPSPELAGFAPTFDALNELGTAETHH